MPFPNLDSSVMRYKATGRYSLTPVDKFETEEGIQFDYLLDIQILDSHFPNSPRYWTLPERLTWKTSGPKTASDDSYSVLELAEGSMFMFRYGIAPAAGSLSGIWVFRQTDFLGKTIALWFWDFSPTLVLSPYSEGNVELTVVVVADAPSDTDSPTVDRLPLDPVVLSIPDGPGKPGGITPMGWLSQPSAHIFPTPHHALNLANSIQQSAQQVAVVSPARGVLYSVGLTIVALPAQGNSLPVYYPDFGLRIAVTEDYEIQLSHLSQLEVEELVSPEALAVYIAACTEDLESQIVNYDPSAPLTKKTVWVPERVFEVNIPVDSGELLGWTGGFPASLLGDGNAIVEPALNFGALDFRKPLPFLAKNYYRQELAQFLFAHSPLELLPNNKLLQYEYLWRKWGTSPVWGQVCFDEPVGMMGNWFLVSQQENPGVVEESDDENGGADQELGVKLSLARDCYDPKWLVMTSNVKSILPDPQDGESPFVLSEKGVFSMTGGTYVSLFHAIVRAPVPDESDVIGFYLFVQDAAATQLHVCFCYESDCVDLDHWVKSALHDCELFGGTGSGWCRFERRPVA